MIYGKPKTTASRIFQKNHPSSYLTRELLLIAHHHLASIASGKLSYMFHSDTHALTALKCGAIDYVIKPCNREDVKNRLE